MIFQYDLKVYTFGKKIVHMKKINTVIVCVVSALSAYSQVKQDKAIYIEKKPGYYENSILKGVEEYQQEKAVAPAPVKRFKMDFAGFEVPNDLGKYKSQWYNNPISQGNTSTCWCFSTTSFYESEAYRLGKVQVKLSEMYPVYWEYVERAKYFVTNRGKMEFSEGSEANAVTRSYKMYGAVPMADFSGMKAGEKFYSHEKMFAELKTYLDNVKATGAWNEEQVVATVKSILNFHMGVPPTSVTYGGKKYSPKEFLDNVLKLKMDDYVEILSLKSEEYYKMAEYKVPDNWWKSAEYYNVPLDVFMTSLKSAIRAGYTISIGGDVSEPGFDPTTQAAVVPSFDIPSEYINEDSRQLRFNNGATTDDHGVHLVGYYEKDGKDWYLIKDSGSGSRNCSVDSKCFGHYFFHEDYVKLKMMNFTVHKDAVKDLLKKFGK